MESLNDFFNYCQEVVQHPIDPSDRDSISTIFQSFFAKIMTKEQAENAIKSIIPISDPIDKFSNQIKMHSYLPYSSARIQSMRNKSRKWNDELDNRLRAAVQSLGTDNWTGVANYVGEGMTKSQCSQRWNRCINPNILHSNWTREEEQKLINAVKQFGDKSWTRISKEISGRTDVQCRFRYHFLLHKASSNKQSDLMPIAPSLADIEKINPHSISSSVNDPSQDISNDLSIDRSDLDIGSLSTTDPPQVSHQDMIQNEKDQF